MEGGLDGFVVRSSLRCERALQPVRELAQATLKRLALGGKLAVLGKPQGLERVPGLAQLPVDLEANALGRVGERAAHALGLVSETRVQTGEDFAVLELGDFLKMRLQPRDRSQEHDEPHDCHQGRDAQTGCHRKQGVCW
jgi:hypothetical protein